MSGAQNDDVDRRFEELMAQEFPEDRPTRMERRRARQEPERTSEPITIFERMDAADEEEWDRGDNRVRPPALPPMGRWSLTTKVGTGLMILSLAMTLAIVFGVPLPGWLNTIAMVAFVVGMGTLLFRLLSTTGTGRDGTGRDDDGARL